MKNILSLIIGVFTMTTSFSQEGDPKATEFWEPVPKIVTPGSNGTAPSDAIILFDGKNLNNWQSLDGNAAKWPVSEGAFTVEKGTGDIKTKQTFGNIQLHIEWRTPSKVVGESQGRGNSGIFFQERYELQVLDSYNNKTYVNGQAGSIYKQTPPLVNATKGPGEWQTYDVVYIAPIYNDDGSLKSPGRITAFLNGVVVQYNTEIQGTTEYIGKPKVIAHGKASLKLQDHGNPVSYRNIWVREL